MFSNFGFRSSRFLCPYIPQQPKLLLRSINFDEKVNYKPILISKSQYRIIYDFPYVKLLGAFVKTKRLVPVATVLLTPLIYYIDGTIGSCVVSLTSAGCYFIAGVYISKFTKNTVGKMYVDKEGEMKNVLISSVDVYGRRVDRIHNVDQIINADFPTHYARILGFIQLGIENSDMYYNLNIHNCKFIDEKACDYILGARWTPGEIKENELVKIEGSKEDSVKIEGAKKQS